jgi:hypothetical protein
VIRRHLCFMGGRVENASTGAEEAASGERRCAQRHSDEAR